MPLRRRTPAAPGAPVAERVDVDEVAVRDLRDIRITGGEQPEDLGNGLVVEIGSPRAPLAR